MRLGGPVFLSQVDPESWVHYLRKWGYKAAYCPVSPGADKNTVKAYAEMAVKSDIVIAEVGAWSNPLSPNEAERRAAIAKCQESLTLADQIGARCCVNISGSRGEQWDGHHPANLTAETFDLIVETVRRIVDAVKPVRTYYTLETMPWMYPDSTESYLQLLKAVDRKRFAVHFDPVNLICSPQRYYGNAALIREFIRELGPYIKSCHAKDISMSGLLTVHLDEVRPGLGNLDYRVLLQELSGLDTDLPLMLEHLQTEEEYRLAGDYIRSVAHEVTGSLLL
jgi:sugar phosphate isomerase/epimerase